MEPCNNSCLAQGVSLHCCPADDVAYCCPLESARRGVGSVAPCSGTRRLAACCYLRKSPERQSPSRGLEVPEQWSVVLLGCRSRRETPLEVYIVILEHQAPSPASPLLPLPEWRRELKSCPCYTVKNIGGPSTLEFGLEPIAGGEEEIAIAACRLPEITRESPKDSTRRRTPCR